MSRASILIITCLLCCTSEEELPISFFQDISDLKSEIIDPGFDLNIPLQMMIIDSTLVIHDKFIVEDNYVLFTFTDLYRQESKFHYFGIEGNGPNQFSFPSSINRIPGEPTKLSVFNNSSGTFSILDLKNIISNNKTDSQFVFKRTDFVLFRALQLNDSLFVGTGLFNKGRVALINKNGSLIGNFLDYPYIENKEDFNSWELGMIFQSQISAHPDGEKFVLATQSSPTLDIIGVNNDSLNVINSKHYSSPKFKNQSVGNTLQPIQTTENIGGFVSVSVTKNYIYLLYSGKTSEESLDEYLSGEIVLKYDWSGNEIERYNLDHRVNLISVTEMDDEIYATMNDLNGNTMLLLYKIHNAL